MVRGARAMGPVEQALSLGDGQVVDGCPTHGHVAMLIEFPILVAVGAVLFTGGIMPLLGETHGDAVTSKGPQFLDETVFKFRRPLAFEVGLDLLTPG